MYKLSNFNGKLMCIQYQIGNVLHSIPFASDNTKYQQFKKDIMDGGELQDADGVVMTPEAAKAFIQTLP